MHADQKTLDVLYINFVFMTVIENTNDKLFNQTSALNGVWLETRSRYINILLQLLGSIEHYSELVRILHRMIDRHESLALVREYTVTNSWEECICSPVSPVFYLMPMLLSFVSRASVFFPNLP